ncbi:MAG TPA: xanthine dehydrogenase subunit D, partial [Candidatus Dormibacteraeota bacterium]|nr:xanthine dehydrogenase subunit D [Candidatus Dormibacteraeota bacterium]
MTDALRTREVLGVGGSVGRPDGTPKVKGAFAYSSDLWAPFMLWGATVRSPHPYARVRRIDVSTALALRGVHAVLTHEDVPGHKLFGLEVADQPVLAWDVVRFQGEAVAVVAADHPETARRAAGLVHVDYEALEPLTDPEAAIGPDAPLLHPRGNVTRHVKIRRGDARAGAAVVVTG